MHAPCSFVFWNDGALDTPAAPPAQNVANERPAEDMRNPRRQESPSSGIAGVVGLRGSGGGAFGGRLAGNGVLLGQPRAQVDQAAAIAAERPERELVRPLDRALAGGTSQTLNHGALLTL